MAERVETVTQVEQPAVNTAATREVAVSRITGTTLAARVVWFIVGVLLALLAFRFIFALLGANPNNGIANFVYSVSHPFVSPFFGLFGYHFQYGVTKFEVYTLVAMAVYAIIGWGIVRLLTIANPNRDAAV